MNKILISMFFLFLMIYSCSSDSKKEDNTKNQQTIIPAEEKKSTVIYLSDSSVVKMNLVNGKAKTHVHKNKDDVIYVEFNSEGYSKLNGSIIPDDSTANIRFSQIFLPDGQMDGPFGRDIEYDLPLQGEYRLSLHESLMAGDPWEGSFYVELELTR